MQRTRVQRTRTARTGAQTTAQITAESAAIRRPKTEPARVPSGGLSSAEVRPTRTVTGRRRFVADSLAGLSVAAFGSVVAGACRPASGVATGVPASPVLAAAPSTPSASAPQRLVGPRWQEVVGSNDRVRVATIGMGIMGFKNSDAVCRVPGVELAAVCDLYDGRLRRAREVYGEALRTSRSSQPGMPSTTEARLTTRS